MGRTASYGQLAARPEKTKEVLALWEEAVKKFHDPAGGIEIVIGPVTAYSASAELLRVRLPPAQV